MPRPIRLIQVHQLSTAPRTDDIKAAALCRMRFALSAIRHTQHHIPYHSARVTEAPIMDRKVDSGKLDLGAAGPAAVQLAVFHHPMIAQGEEIVERDIGRSLHSSYDLHLCSAVPLTHEQYHCRRRLAVKQG
jgi:hypothetical protein